MKDEKEKIDFINSNKDRIDKAIKEIKSKFGKYIYKYKWLSGSSTEVYPITIWRDYISIQTNKLNSFNKNTLDKFIYTYKDLFKCAYPCKNDGSCPDELRLFFK